MKSEFLYKTYEQLLQEVQDLQFQLDEANDTIEAIRTGQVDALVVQSDAGHQLYTLKTADHTYRVFLDKMAEGAVTVDQNGMILYCNSQFAHMVQQSISGMIGKPFALVIHEADQDVYRQLFEKCWSGDCKGEVLLIGGGGSIPVQLSLNTLELEEGMVLSIILTDLTAQKKTEQQLKDYNQQLETSNRALEVSNHDLQQFASIASHDLQEPLRKIQIFTDMLQVRHPDMPAESTVLMKKIISSAARMKMLIIDVLNYSKLSADNMQKDCVDLNEIITELCDDFELIIAEKKAVIRNKGLPRLQVNKGQIRQVFQNIISNALKFSSFEKAPQIELSARRTGERSFHAPERPDGMYCIISITDNGIGFDDKYVENIFALFERLNSKDKYEGTGIGLAITKKIIEKHNGLITAESTEGAGATFRILLPVS